LGESAIAQRIEHWEEGLPKSLKLAYLPNLGKVRLRISGKGADEKQLEQLIDYEFDKLIPLIKDIFVGYEDHTSLEEKIQAQFLAKKMTLATAESCTGGQIASLLTKVPGASGYFKGGVVPYHTQTKETVLEVPIELIEKDSVVSQSVVEAMAQQVREKFQATVGLATTGNAGPSKGDSDAEIGTVWIAIATKDRVLSEKFLFGKHRERVVGKAVNKALEMLFKELI